MRSIAVSLIASTLMGLASPAFAESVSAPLTLSNALAAAALITGSSIVASTLEQQNAATNAAAPSPAFGLNSSLGQAPKAGAPPENTLTGQLTLNIGSRASRLSALRTAQAGTMQALATAASARRTAAQGIVTTFFAVATDQAQLAAATANTALAERSLDAGRPSGTESALRRSSTCNVLRQRSPLHKPTSRRPWPRFRAIGQRSLH